MSIYCTLVMLDESHTEGCASSRDTPTSTKENPTMPENPLSNAHVVVPSAPSDEPEDNPYRAADAVVPGADVLPPAAIAEDAWDEGHAAGFAAGRAAPPIPWGRVRELLLSDTRPENDEFWVWVCPDHGIVSEHNLLEGVDWSNPNPDGDIYTDEFFCGTPNCQRPVESFDLRPALAAAVDHAEKEER